jgi:hypothetical protein
LGNQRGGECGKLIIGVFIHGAKDTDISLALEEFADAVLDRNIDNIKEAIVKESFLSF